MSSHQNARNRMMNAEQNLADRITVVDGSFEDIPAPDQSFDLVWSQDAILHSGQRERVLARQGMTEENPQSPSLPGQT